MNWLLLFVSVLNMVLQVAIYRRAQPSVLMDYKAAAAISGSIWLLIATWCVVQLASEPK